MIECDKSFIDAVKSRIVSVSEFYYVIKMNVDRYGCLWGDGLEIYSELIINDIFNIKPFKLFERNSLVK